MMKDKDRTVWSSDQGLPLSGVRKQESKSQKIISLPPHQQTIYLHRDSKGRGGSSVTLLKNLVLSEQDMKALAKKLKQLCGSGGTVKDNVIEIQGEHREKIAEELKKIGYKVKIAGG
jgi:translation initiation factor 1